MFRSFDDIFEPCKYLKMYQLTYFVLLVATFYLLGVDAHGRILNPPMRASIWRFSEFEHLNPPVMYDDDAFWCGGFVTQHNKNGGKCGVCGDNWADPPPRSQEDGGIYGQGIIVRNYTAGQVIPITIELTGAHDGYFEYRICPRNFQSDPETQECYDSNLLQLADGSGTKQQASRRKGLYHTKVRLPQGLKCSRCALQWNYRTGNNWGSCGNGTSAVGCGPQEHFRGCSDIAIH